MVISLNYWQKLTQYKIYSQERRRERYMIVFLWRVSQGMVSGYNIQFSSKDGQRGRSALLHSLLLSSPASVRRAREYSLGVKGARLFNLIPAEISMVQMLRTSRRLWTPFLKMFQTSPQFQAWADLQKLTVFYIKFLR